MQALFVGDISKGGPSPALLGQKSLVSFIYGGTLWACRQASKEHSFAHMSLCPLSSKPAKTPTTRLHRLDTFQRGIELEPTTAHCATSSSSTARRGKALLACAGKLGEKRLSLASSGGLGGNIGIFIISPQRSRNRELVASSNQTEKNIVVENAGDYSAMFMDLWESFEE
ncbi:hypothetical protein VNO77_30818 [Canavalia gladiata]|uniref:Uncharacterized protein n=1 Tax=Canavalia gladiata TaxID=3824 RepID=A0AAN9Q7F8_CANGL